MADAGTGDALQGPEDAGAVVVVNGGLEAEADDDNSGAAEGRFESLLHAASGNSAGTAQASTTNRRERAIGAVLHRR
jgi:hypothetical protein